MKRMLALFLVLVTVLSSAWMFAGCSNPGDLDEDKGAEINWFFVGEIYDFDPAKAYTNDEAMKVLSLIYEPLFSLDANGDLQYALAKDYRFFTYNDAFMMEITLRDTAWTSKEPVTADDVVYAWMRILANDFPCQAATLLYDIKGARAAKTAEKAGENEYDVGISSTQNGKVVQIEFERELDADEQMTFLRNLTSVALSPVRGDVIEKDKDIMVDYWAKRVSTIETNGPFALRVIDHVDVDTDEVSGHQFRLERNPNYRRKADGSNAEDLYVTPYSFFSYWDTDLDKTFEQFIEESIFIAGDIPVEKRAEYLSKAQVSNNLSTYTYVLDNTDPVFADARARRAFSLVLDRATMATTQTGGLAIPATGFVSHGVLNGASGSFSNITAGSAYALSTSANMDAAVALMKEAKADGYTGGSIRILHRDNPEETAIAEAVEDAWEELLRKSGVSGSVTLVSENATEFVIIEGDGTKEDDKVTLYKDAIQEAFRLNTDPEKDGFTYDGAIVGCNVIAIDYQMLSPDAFPVLADFARGFSGNGYHVNGLVPDDNYLNIHVSGYESETYAAKIAEAYAADDLATRTALLHEAEELLLADMPVIPLFFNRSAMLVSDQIRRVYTDYYGNAVLNRTELRNYHKYLTKTED